ncbi:MAG: YchE family NAAT transporter [Hahellaceae bacterium]|nr:YchE family NAAT transporter [Hahellaceae bacterium]
MLEIHEYTKILIGLIAIVNPLGAVPIIMSMTASYSDQEKHAITRTAVFSVGIILLASLFFGETVLAFFGISIPSFRVAGGILIFIIALSMLYAKTTETKQTEEESQESENKESIAVVPLSIPVLAGPGAISTVILYAHKGTGWAHYLMVAVDILVLSTLLFLVLKLVPFLVKRISKTGINIFTRLMGLILASIAVEFIANGLKGLFPQLI